MTTDISETTTSREPGEQRQLALEQITRIHVVFSCAHPGAPVPVYLSPDRARAERVAELYAGVSSEPRIEVLEAHALAALRASEPELPDPDEPSLELLEELLA